MLLFARTVMGYRRWCWWYCYRSNNSNKISLQNIHCRRTTCSPCLLPITLITMPGNNGTELGGAQRTWTKIENPQQIELNWTTTDNNEHPICWFSVDFSLSGTAVWHCWTNWKAITNNMTIAFSYDSMSYFLNVCAHTNRDSRESGRIHSRWSHSIADASYRTIFPPHLSPQDILNILLLLLNTMPWATSAVCHVDGLVAKVCVSVFLWFFVSVFGEALVAKVNVVRPIATPAKHVRDEFSSISPKNSIFLCCSPRPTTRINGRIYACLKYHQHSESLQRWLIQSMRRQSEM